MAKIAPEKKSKTEKKIAPVKKTPEVPVKRPRGRPRKKVETTEVASVKKKLPVKSKERQPAYKTEARKHVEQYTFERKQVMDFIGDNFIQGVDYGKSYGGADKDSLLKPGMEKICQLLQLEPVFLPDLDTWSMFGSPEGTVCLICFLLTEDRKQKALKQIAELGLEFKYEVYRLLAIAEGRGSGNMVEHSKVKDNWLIKIVEKRSLGDATLRVAGLSDVYTVDMEANGEEDEKGHEPTPPPPRKSEKAQPPKQTTTKKEDSTAKTQKGDAWKKDARFAGMKLIGFEVAEMLKTGKENGSMTEQYVKKTLNRMLLNKGNADFLEGLKDEVGKTIKAKKTGGGKK